MSQVLAILRWARDPAGPPPGGPLDDLEATLDSLAECRATLGELVAGFAARHHLQPPPFGEPRLDSTCPLLLARVLGLVSNPRGARLVLDWLRLPAAATLLEALARHLLVAPGLPYLAPTLGEDLRLASPLTALLERPAAGGAHAAMALALRLLRRADARCFLVRTLAEPSTEHSICAWRARLMEGLRGHSEEGARAVLDIYETTMVHHHEAALAQIRGAFAVLSGGMADRQRLESTLALGDWWGPLAALGRANGRALRDRRYLGYDFPQGLELHRAVNRLRGVL